MKIFLTLAVIIVTMFVYLHGYQPDMTVGYWEYA